MRRFVKSFHIGRFLSPFLLAAAVCACSGDDETVVTGITLSVQEMSFGSEGGTQAFIVKSQEKPSVASSDDWIGIQTGEQSKTLKETKVILTVSANTGEDRSAIVTATAGKENRTVNITQKGVSVPTRTAMDIAKDMYPGWNLGNTLEAGPCSWLPKKLDWETGWQPTKTTQAIIDCVKESGFHAIRIPCAWETHSDSNGDIDAAWMARVREIVDYCMNAGLYVVLNDHWDNGWIEVDGFSDLSEANVSAKEKRLSDIWTQVATEFRNHSDYLLFAGFNEPHCADQPTTDVLIRYEQAFINAVRASGGNNTTRFLVVQGSSTDINRSIEYYDVTRLSDTAEKALMIEVHYYDPGQFCGTWDSTGGSAFYYWGAVNHTGRHDANWGEESHMAGQFAKLKDKYTSKGYPVIIGEYAGQQRTLPAGENQAKHNASVKLFYKCVNEYAVNNGLVPFAWDTNSPEDLKKEPGAGTIIDRAGCKVVGIYAMEGIKEGVAAANWPY